MRSMVVGARRDPCYSSWAMRTDRKTVSRARELRRPLSEPEFRLWMRLRGKAEGLPRFRRQHPMGPFVLDFYCPRARLAVEVDGISHSMGDRPERDLARDAWLTARGVTVLRIAAVDVLRDPDGIADSLVRAAAALVSPR